MPYKTTHLILFLFTLSIFSLNAQPTENKCNCLLLKNTEENDKKVVELAQQIETSFHEMKPEIFKDKFDDRTFIDFVLNNDEIDKDDEYVKGFVNGLSDGMNTIYNNITKEIENGAYYNLVNYEYNIVERSYYIMFRIYSEETGVNYHDYRVCTDGINIKFNDIYIYLTAEHLSKTFQHLLLGSMPKKSYVSNFFGINQNDDILVVNTARKLMRQGNYKKAYEKILEIDGPLANEKFILIIKSMIASGVSDKLYEENLKEFAKLFPNDPTLYLKQIDYYFLKENYPMVHEKIDKLIFETEDDFLYIIKAKVFLMTKDYENADSHYSYMIENYPDLIEGYFGYISSLTYQERFTEALKIIDNLVLKGYEKKVLSDFIEEKEDDGTNVLQPLVDSDVYQKWKIKTD